MSLSLVSFSCFSQFSFSFFSLAAGSRMRGVPFSSRELLANISACLCRACSRRAAISSCVRGLKSKKPTCALSIVKQFSSLKNYAVRRFTLIYNKLYLFLCFGRTLSSTANIFETNTMTGASSAEEQARKSTRKAKQLHRNNITESNKIEVATSEIKSNQVKSKVGKGKVPGVP